jgi:hypothetical protein
VRRNECLTAIIDVLDDAHVAYIVEHGGKHLKVWFTIAGRRHRFICPVSPSDTNARHHARAYARRVLKELRP